MESYIMKPTGELETVLSSPGVKDQIDGIRSRILQDTILLMESEGFDLEMTDPRKSLRIRQEFWHSGDVYRPVLKTHVLDELSLPYSVTIDDLSKGFLEHLIVRDEDFDLAYERFVVSMCFLAEEIQRSRPFPIARMSRERITPLSRERLQAMREGREERPKPLDFDQRSIDTIPIGTRLWGSPSDDGAQLKVVGTMPSPYSERHDVSSEELLVYVAISGEMSPQACKQLRRELRSVARSIGWSYECLHLRESYESGITRYLSLGADDVPLWSKFFRECLDAFYIPRPRPNSVELRLRNAIHLLVEADRQARPGLGLAMCVTAMEALLVKERKEITEQLGVRGATLLEPENDRRPAAKKLIKKLYDRRSRVLHGEEVEGDAESLSQTRIVTAAILKAMLDRKGFRRRNSEAEETPEQLLNAMDSAWVKKERVDGVLEIDAVRCLWK